MAVRHWVMGEVLASLLRSSYVDSLFKVIGNRAIPQNTVVFSQNDKFTALSQRMLINKTFNGKTPHKGEKEGSTVHHHSFNYHIN